MASASGDFTIDLRKLRLLRELDKTVVFVTHDIDEALLLGDQIAIFKPGGIVAQVGTPEQILADPADDFVTRFVGADRGKRVLHLRSESGREVVVDGDGRPAGVLAQDAASGEASRVIDEAGAAAAAAGASAQGDQRP